MKKHKNPVESTAPADADRLPAATFKNSLRLWQARWKSQQAAGAGGAGTPADTPGQPSPDPDDKVSG
jgi:hypothetical protein